MSDELDPARREISQLKLERDRARADLQEFTYSVSHDLRALLRHVSAYVQVIREDLGTHVDKGIAASLDTVSAAARNMGVLIDGLTEYSRVGNASLAPVRVDTAAMLQELCRSMMVEMGGRTVEWDIAPDLPAVSADPALVRQIWTALLANALKFTRGRSPAMIEISGMVAEGSRFCEFMLKDNGAGFNPRHKDKLFKVFQRLHSANEFEGVGLGLALTRKMVERHGGTIEADGNVDGGCWVRFTLPLAPPLV